MNKNIGPYRVVDLTPGRRVWINALDLSEPTHWMVGLLEVDVTVLRQRLASHKERTGEALSFTGFLVYCLARAVDENKSVQSYLKGRKQLVMFDDVDVGLMVERAVDGKTTLLVHVIRAANRKTFPEIHQEIRLAQSGPLPAGGGMPGWFRTAMLLPWPFSNLFKALLNWGVRRDPTVRVASSGTVGVTAIGMFGKGHSGWGLATNPNSLGLVVGSTSWKPAVVEGRIEPREILNLTVLFDHDVVDGAPAARFTHRLIELIESGDSLGEAAGQ